MKNDVVQLNITDLTPEGFGVGRHAGKVFFVADTAVGDVIEATVLKELKNRSFAKVKEIITPSPDRIESDCAVSQKCGGCVFRHISYEAELELKRNIVKQAFSRIANIDIPVDETVFNNPELYRNKVQYPFAQSKDGKCVFGYYARRSHRIVEHDFCPLQDNVFCEIASFCAKKADSLGISAFDEEKGKGILRHIVMRKNRVGEILVTLVAFKEHKKLQTLGECIFDRFKNVVGVHINLNKRRDNVIFGDETKKLVGLDTLNDRLCEKSFEISPRSFYQVNAEMAEKLYNAAKALAFDDNEKEKTVLDLYCGIGTIGLSLVRENDKLCGVEIIEDAVENAKKNAKMNGRTDENTLFVCGDAEIGVNECKNKFGLPDIIIVDPPRKGLEPEVIKTIVNANPEKIVYISCDPATLSRDCALFAESGYKTDKATPFDLFPRTGHVESLVCLTKQ